MGCVQSNVVEDLGAGDQVGDLSALHQTQWTEREFMHAIFIRRPVPAVQLQVFEQCSM